MENQTPEVVVPQQSKLNPMLWVVIGVAILAAGVGIGLTAGKYFQSASSTIPTSKTVLSPTPSFVAVPVEADPTAGWKTYKIIHDFKFGFSDYEIKLPESWKIQEHSSSFQNSEMFTYTKPTSQTAGGDFTPGMAWLTINISESPISQIIQSDENKQSESKALINGLEFTKLNGYGGVGGSVYYSNFMTPYKGKTYQISFSTQDEAIKVQILRDIDQILSTFKFMKEEVSADPETHKSWTTYTDKDAKFIIQYPQGWILRKTYGASVNNTGNYRVSGVDISTNLSTGSTVVVNIIDPRNETFENWVKLHSGETNVPNAVNSSYKNIPAYRFERFREGRPAEVVTYYALSNNLIVFMALNPSLADQAVGELILSSFKFTN